MNRDDQIPLPLSLGAPKAGRTPRQRVAKNSSHPPAAFVSALSAGLSHSSRQLSVVTRQTSTYSTRMQQTAHQKETVQNDSLPIRQPTRKAARCSIHSTFRQRTRSSLAKTPKPHHWFCVCRRSRQTCSLTFHRKLQRWLQLGGHSKLMRLTPLRPLCARRVRKVAC